MDNYFSDNSYGPSSDPESNKWSERAWLDYIKRSESEIAIISSLYDKNRAEGMDFEDIANIAGWPVSYHNQEALLADSTVPEFSKEPLTLINHPIYIVSRALIRSLERNLEVIVGESDATPKSAWSIAKSIHEASNLIIVAVNSTDLGEDMLAHSFYKSAVSCLNCVIAEIESLETLPSAHLQKARLGAINAVFDLRQMCLNLS